MKAAPRTLDPAHDSGPRFGEARPCALEMLGQLEEVWELRSGELDALNSSATNVRSDVQAERAMSPPTGCRHVHPVDAGRRHHPHRVTPTEEPDDGERLTLQRHDTVDALRGDHGETQSRPPHAETPHPYG